MGPEHFSHLNQDRHPKPRDLELNYYLRSARQREFDRGRQIAGSLRGLKGVNAPIPRGETAVFHVVHPLNRYPLYVALLYLGSAVICSLFCWKGGNKGNKVESRDKAHSVSDVEQKSCQTVVPVSQAGQETSNPLGLIGLPSSSSIIASLWSWPSNTCGHPQESQTTNETSRQRLSETIIGLCDNGQNHTAGSSISSAIDQALFSVKGAWAERCSGISRREKLDFIASLRQSAVGWSEMVCEVYHLLSSEGIVFSTNSPGIGSSLEDVWEGNSPLINPAMPNQLRSLLAVPELCV